MKNTLLTSLSVLLVFIVTSCKDGKITDSNSSTIQKNGTTIDSVKKEDPSNNNLKTLQLGDYQMTYHSRYEFVYNEQFSNNLKNDVTDIVEGSYFNLNMPIDFAVVGLNYSKYETIVYPESAIDGIIGGYKRIQGVVLKNEKTEDLENHYGFNAKMGSGTIKFSEVSTVGEYRFLVLSNKNELIMIQGLFEQAGSKSADEFLTLLKSIKL